MTLPDLPTPRRVVTGHTAEGKSVILQDGAPPRDLRVPERPGYRMANLWRTGAPPWDAEAPEDVAAHVGVMPPAGGTVLRVIDFPPESDDPEVIRKMAQATFRSIYPDADHTGKAGGHGGMHRTLSVDYAMVLKGSIFAVMDEGETELHAGDVLVQRGTNHAWSNRADGICRMCFVLVDAAGQG